MVHVHFDQLRVWPIIGHDVHGIHLLRHIYVPVARYWYCHLSCAHVEDVFFTRTFNLFFAGVSGDKVGLAITQAMALTGMLQWGIRQSAEVANQLMSVERIMEYRDLDAEKEPLKPREVAKTWPAQGQIEFRNVIYKYFPEAEPVLRGLTFVVRPGEKIGIVGRTGAGKSSLIGAIFRLAVVDGQVLIDDVDTSTISLENLRSRVSIIPQDPVLFSGTLRR